MTAPAVGRVDLATLERLHTLGDGGQGVVYLVRRHGEPTPLAYKEYRPPVRPEVDWSALENLVRRRAETDPGTRMWLDEHAAWPSAVVVRGGGTPCGFLMPLAPRDFTVRLRARDTLDSYLFTVEFLLNPPDYLRRIGLHVSQVDALRLLLELATMLERLHALGIAVGDLSPRNIVVSLRPPRPRCFLLDCDAVRCGATSVLPQVETADWQVPAGEELATAASDVYKLALLVLRLLAGDQVTRDPRVVRPLFLELADVAERSITADPHVRPAAGEWVGVLGRAASHALSMAPATASVQPGTGSPRRPLSSPPSSPSLPRPRASTARSRWWIGVASVVLAVFCLGLYLGYGAATGAPPPATAAHAAGPLVSPSAVRPTSVGMVGYLGIIADDRVADVARMFDRYFSAISGRDFATALAVYDPAGTFDPTDPAQRAAFTKGVETSRYADIVIAHLSSGPGDVAVVATVRFTSRQERGYGPRRDPNETCTRWVVTYWLSEPTPGQYRVLRDRATSRAC